jgi:hypothetical protein
LMSKLMSSKKSEWVMLASLGLEKEEASWIIMVGVDVSWLEGVGE